MTYHKSGNPTGVAKGRVCADCYHQIFTRICKETHIVSEWVEDETGHYRTVTGGLCAKTEDYVRPSA